MSKLLHKCLPTFALMAVAASTPIRADIIYNYVDPTFNQHVNFSLPSFLTEDNLPASSLTIATGDPGTVSGFFFDIDAGGFCDQGDLPSPCVQVNYNGGSLSESVGLTFVSSIGNVLTYQGTFATSTFFTITSPASNAPEPATWGTLVLGIGAMLIVPWRRRNDSLHG